MNEPQTKFPSVKMYGINVSKMNMKETVQYLTEAVQHKETHQVITANPIMFMAALNDASFAKAMQSAELVVPDGTGLVWAADYVGHPVKERVPGFDLMFDLLKVANEKSWKVYLLGTTAEAIQESATKLKKQYPNIDFVKARDGFFTEKEDMDVVEDIRKLSPDLLFIARSVETQEPWIYKYKRELNIPVMMGVGGTFDIIAGKLKRAPKWMQKLRLEWFYRLLQQPSRYKRMLDLPKFVFRVRRDKDIIIEKK
ncbi:WecB/TagA/CpsF family glycosyltransferase [Chengkuizengella axinellae]|uniref:N-acetylglucosaminyldiphosphoundecaprenol N-acetyl-beta-D-mannosaminyltransferase n=1 Tax=Chengkuizengella axinellae TaxID=3064388 RepID=A0ABT9J0U7_9BACL|nr:WecB/TagA/CpsF family glycosyltransferase [Chengkuizengella sp. 2205SS18-9]MDP5274634.1 WecB/TagA/CpsF family glycosyltransferase [Chengkuizengella sp. 2205SS18-9]